MIRNFLIGFLAFAMIMISTPVMAQQQDIIRTNGMTCEYWVEIEGDVFQVEWSFSDGFDPAPLRTPLGKINHCFDNDTGTAKVDAEVLYDCAPNGADFDCSRATDSLSFPIQNPNADFAQDIKEKSQIIGTNLVDLILYVGGAILGLLVTCIGTGICKLGN